MSPLPGGATVGVIIPFFTALGVSSRIIQYNNNYLHFLLDHITVRILLPSSISQPI